MITNLAQEEEILYKFIDFFNRCFACIQISCTYKGKKDKITFKLTDGGLIVNYAINILLFIEMIHLMVYNTLSNIKVI